MLTDNDGDGLFQNDVSDCDVLYLDIDLPSGLFVDISSVEEPEIPNYKGESKC